MDSNILKTIAVITCVAIVATGAAAILAPGSGPIVASIGTLATLVVLQLFQNSTAHAKAKQIEAKVEKVVDQTNGLVDRIVEAARTEARAAGVTAERERLK